MPFTKGKKKTGGIQRGQKHKKTLIKQNLGIETINKVDEFEVLLLNNWLEFLKADDNSIRLTATKELSKFVFPTKKQIESTSRSLSIEEIVRQDIISYDTPSSEG